MLVIGGLLLLLDQWSKHTVQAYVRGRCVPFGPVLRIRCVATPRAFYRTPSARVGLVLGWVAALGSAVVLHLSGAWFQSPVAQVGLGLAFGGAAGNLLDILQSRAIVDFIDLGWWPVFNVADVAIVAGLVMALAPSLSPA